jgi:peptidoglycan/xylan/chitin deacetylase (PgdA/CDA1 family)
MQNSRKSIARRKRWVAISIAGLLLLGLASAGIARTASETREPPTVVVRVDDIQDYAFEDGQFFLLNENMANGVPLSLAVIAGEFGQDFEVVQAIQRAVASGSEVTVHGWKHEDLAALSFDQQAALLLTARNRLQGILTLDTKVLVPPMYSFDDDTIAAMREEGYNIISSYTDLSEPGSLSDVLSIPATVQLSDYSDANDTWTMKSLDAVKAEISASVQKYGFAVIVTHPQEFLSAGAELNPANVRLYRALLKTLKQNYSFKTLESLGENWRK